MKKWLKRLIYPHQYSSDAYIKYLRNCGAKIGKDVKFYNPPSNMVDDVNAMFIEIGDNVQITRDVKILAHDYSFSVIANAFCDFSRKQTKVRIGNNVFIGQNAVVLMGANVGDNIIIGAGSVVVGSVESNSVYAGNPARKICSLEELAQKNRARFEESAATYAQCFEKKKGRLPNPEEMKIYQALFVSKDELKKYVKNENYGFTITEAAKNNIKCDVCQRYNSVEDFMKSMKNNKKTADWKQWNKQKNNVLNDNVYRIVFFAKKIIVSFFLLKNC